jgi:hypothetical protein
VVLKCKMNKVAMYLKLRLDDAAFDEYRAAKLARSKHRPRKPEGAVWSDIWSAESAFPTKFRWMDSVHFDTHFSGCSIALAECERARVVGDAARK